jgi:hypothetical protein
MIHCNYTNINLTKTVSKYIKQNYLSLKAEHGNDKTHLRLKEKEFVITLDKCVMKYGEHKIYSAL